MSFIRSVVSASLAAALMFPAAAFSASEIHDAHGVAFALSVQQQDADDEVFAVLEIGEYPRPGELFRSTFEQARSGQLEVMISAQRIRHAYAPYVYFAQAGCGGQAFLSARGAEQGMDLKAGIAGADFTLYLASGHVQLAQVRSVLYDGQCSAFEHSVLALPAVADIALAERWPAPYQW